MPPNKDSIKLNRPISASENSLKGIGESKSLNENVMSLDSQIEDPFCSPTKPQIVTFADVTSASFKVKNGIINTTCTQKPRLSELAGMEIYLKKDYMQVTGSFKERGALYALLMLSEGKKQTGVISASLGNHALALCYHGKLLKIPVTVVMPVIAPMMKIQACRRYGADVVIDGNDMKEAKLIAMKMGKDLGLTYINGYDHPHIIAGQGTLGLEIVEQVPDMDAVIIPVGGGGLLAGIALAIKTLLPHVKIYGVESDKCPSFSKALELGTPTPVPISSTLADGLAVPLVGYNAFATAKDLIDKMIVVKEEWIAIAILRLVELDKCVVEGAGACGLAAILAGLVDELKGKKSSFTIVWWQY
uniref:Serine racemase n=1 Tax=Clastoptera arizonana TaxID=38151 RepID=A0A1B6D453_9HEMI